MGRALRAAIGGLVYHVLNRANAWQTLFDTPADYEAFEQVLAEAQDECPVPLLAYCVMPNHWHLVLAPEGDGDLCRFVERNALRAGLVQRAEDWRCGSLVRRLRGVAEPAVELGVGPVPLPRDWRAWVNAPQTPAEEEAVRRCRRRGQPYGSTAWV